MYKYFLSFLAIWLFSFYLFGNSYERALEYKKAKLDIHWYTSVPFVYKDKESNVTGLEYEIIMAFQGFLKAEKQIDLEINWIETASFYDVLNTVQNSKSLDVLGVSAISITEERKLRMKYTDSYLPDITVLISSQGTPIVKNFDEINVMMSTMKAYTIKGTVYEDHLLNIKSQLNIDFEMEYIHSDKNVLDYVSKNKNSFGFIDLPIYLMWMKNGSELVRQNFFTVNGTGYGFVMPLGSDWNLLLNEFFADPKYKELVAEIISRNIGPELYEFIDQIREGNFLGTSLLTKEKEIQLALIKNANLRLAEDEAFKKLLLFGMCAALLLLVVIGFVLYNNQKTTRLLIGQKMQIELQQADIRRKNEQLINRNAKLIDINDEKNNLVRILAHDLRAPLGNINGLLGLMGKSIEKLSDEEKGYFEHIKDSSNRMNSMISKILNVDTLEGNKNLVFIEPVNIDQMVKDLSMKYRSVAAQKSIDFRHSLDKKNCELETDHILLYLVLENLISNAIKFSPANTRVKLEVISKKEEIIFKISDQGPGFTDEDKVHIFGRFQKLSAKPTGDEPSTGLGLSIVKKYVIDLGGKVWLESEAGRGSAFFVSIPN